MYLTHKKLLGSYSFKTLKWSFDNVVSNFQPPLHWAFFNFPRERCEKKFKVFESL